MVCSRCQERHCARDFPENGFHHGQMLQVLMRLKCRLASEKLEKNASHAPDVAWVRPPQSCDCRKVSIHIFKERSQEERTCIALGYFITSKCVSKADDALLHMLRHDTYPIRLQEHDNAVWTRLRHDVHSHTWLSPDRSRRLPSFSPL
jgi:hypothetical protein